MRDVYAFPQRQHAYFTDEVFALVLYSTVTKVIAVNSIGGQPKAVGTEIGDTRKTRSDQRGQTGKRWASGQ